MSEIPSTNYSVVQHHTSGSEQSFSARPLNVTEPVVAKRVCFYKSGDPQFNGVKMVVNNRSFKSFDALLDNLSKRVPLPFGVRNITTPRGIHSINNLEELEDGKSYICSQQRKVKPINLEMARKKPLPWQNSRPISARRRAVQLAREGDRGIFQRGSTVKLSTPKKLLVFKNGNVRVRRAVILGKKNTENFEAFLEHISELMQYPVMKLYTTDGRKVPNLQALVLCSGTVVAAGKEPFKAGNYDPHRYSLPGKLPGATNRVYPRSNAKSESRKMSAQIDSSSRSQMFSASSSKGYSNDNNSVPSYVPDNDMILVGNSSQTGEEFCIVPTADDIEKSVHLNQDGSMTVEMKVRLNIKEEETIKWTTCVSRAGTFATTTEDQLSELNILTYKNTDEDSSHAEDDVSLQQISTEMTNQNSVGIMESSTYDIWQNPSVNPDLNHTDNNNSKPHFYRPPTPGPRRVRQKKALVESVTVVSDRAVQKKLVGQFSFSEEMDSGETKSEYCMVTHASSQTSSVTNSNPLSNHDDATESNPHFFNTRSEWSRSKNEDIICNQCKELLSSQASQHPSPPETNETVCKCAQITSTVMQLSHTTGKNDSAEGMTARQLSDESQAVSTSSKTKKNKKKKKKSSAHIMKQAIGSHENLDDVSMEGSAVNDVQTTEVHTPRESTQRSSTKITTKKIVLAFPVGNSHNSNKNVITEEELCSEDPLQSQPNELLSKLKKIPNRQLPKLKVKSDKKHNLPQSTKAEGLLLIKNNSNNDTQHAQEIIHDSINVTDQTSTHLASLKPITDQESDLNVETEHAKTTSNQTHKLSMKHKKTKKNKKIESAPASEVEADRSLAALRHRDFTDEITEHSLENYVQSWLQNIFPDAVRPDQCLAPISSNDRKKQQPSIKSFPGSELAGKNSINVGKESNHLSEIETVEESVQELKNIYEKHIGCLTDADASLIEEAKYLLQSNIQNNAKLSKIIHEHEKKKVPTEDVGQRHMSAIAAHVHAQTNNNILGTDVEEDCMSNALLHELKSAILNAEKNNIGCIKKSCCLTDNYLPSLLGSPSDLLLAWLLLLNLKESLSNVNKDDVMQTTCRCSEIFTLLTYLKQVAVKEKADDLKNAVSNMQDCTANYLILSTKQTERQEPVSLVQIKNISDAKEQDDLNKKINSEAVDSNERISEEQKKGSLLVENSNLHDLNVNGDCGPVPLNNSDLISNEKSLKENEDSSMQESQEKHTDASYNNEESEISEEPKSTSHSITSHDKDHFFEIETSEVDEKELKSTEEQECKESFCKTENRNEILTSAAENATNGDKLEDSTHEDIEEDGTCEESSDRLSQQSPLSFCYESKQIPADACEEEPPSRVKLIVKELECGGFHSSSSMEFKKCLKSPATSDLSDYRPESDESDYNFRQSSDLTNGSADEALYEKEYNKGYVKRTIERLYGKTEASSKPGPPYLTQALQKDTEEPFHTVMEKNHAFCEAHNSWSNDDMSSSLVSHEIPQDLYTTNSEWEKENATLPAPQFSLNGEEAYYNDDYVNQYNQSSGPSAEDGGVLIEKGKWLLKEDHLIRRSPPENNGMYGTTDTSADTAFDNHSDDIPYSHFGNLDSRPPLKEISSSELEDMIKPCDNGCNYFNMPHNSDSEPFPDALSVKSQNSQIGSTLPLKATRKTTNSTDISADVNASPPAFTSVEFRLPDNKVHPTDQPLNDEPIQTQPSRNSIRNSREDQDSLDKLHAICGQHCPILMAIIKPTNEAIRGCAYQKASDIENQVGLRLFTHSPPVMWQDKHEIGFDKNQSQLKNNSINKIAHKIFDRFYADNALDFMNDANFRLLLSLKENPGLKKLSITESIAVNLQEINNHENYAVEEALGEITVGQNNNLSVSQSSRGNINQIPPSFPEALEDCGCETFHYQETFLNKTDGNLTVNLEEENALNVKDETLSSVKEKQSGTESADS